MAYQLRINPDQTLLTPTQAKVLVHAAMGNDDKEIAKILGNSPRTIETHLKEIYFRLGKYESRRLTRLTAAFEAVNQGVLNLVVE